MCLETRISNSFTNASYSCKNVPLEQAVYISQKLYVVAKYFVNGPLEIIESTVITMRYNPKTEKKYFSVQGRWGNGNWYNGTFSASSLTKSVFFTKEDAEKNINKKNNRSK